MAVDSSILARPHKKLADLSITCWEYYQTLNRPGEGNGNPLQYPCLENSMDAGAWWATVHGVPKSQTRLSDFNVNVPILKKFRYFL